MLLSHHSWRLSLWFVIIWKKSSPVLCEISSSHGGEYEVRWSPWWWRQLVPLKRQSTIILHDSTSQKTNLKSCSSSRSHLSICFEWTMKRAEVLSGHPVSRVRYLLSTASTSRCYPASTSIITPQWNVFFFNLFICSKESVLLFVAAAGRVRPTR
jgi:hypothetical protein